MRPRNIGYLKIAVELKKVVFCFGEQGTRRGRRRVLDEVFAELAEEFEEEIRRESRHHF